MLRYYLKSGYIDTNVDQAPLLLPEINDGDDILFGGSGADRSAGYGGADSFVLFRDEILDTLDRITDFSMAEGDRVTLREVLEGYDPLHDLIGDFVSVTQSATLLLTQQGHERFTSLRPKRA